MQDSERETARVPHADVSVESHLAAGGGYRGGSSPPVPLRRLIYACARDHMLPGACSAALLKETDQLLETETRIRVELSVPIVPGRR